MYSATCTKKRQRCSRCQTKGKVQVIYNAMDRDTGGRCKSFTFDGEVIDRESQIPDPWSVSGTALGPLSCRFRSRSQTRRLLLN